MSVYTYIIQSETDGSYYIGITSHLWKRMKDHNRGRNKTSRHSRPWKLIYKEKHEDYEVARRREKYFKSGKGRKWIRETFREKD
jgi:predicted GIY-YIG superfamily endonuclease